LLSVQHNTRSLYGEGMATPMDPLNTQVERFRGSESALLAAVPATTQREIPKTAVADA
jgi:hypothetical protein